MKVVNTIDLKNKTEDDLEDFVLEHSRKVRKMLVEAEADRQAGRVTPLESYLAKQRVK